MYFHPMGISKTDLFSDHQNQIAAFAKALSHPARVAIIQKLLEHDTCVNHLLVEELGLSQATISQHLQSLKNSGLIKGNISGKHINYCLNSENWNELSAIFKMIIDHQVDPLKQKC